jgi:hypothetical protein
LGGSNTGCWRYFEAELYRLRGEALLAGAGTVSDDETAIKTGIAVARRQNAKSWEFCGTTSLARLRRQQGRQEEAVALLAPILGWFEEGFDAADLKAARTLLDDLENPRHAQSRRLTAGSGRPSSARGGIIDEMALGMTMVTVQNLLSLLDGKPIRDNVVNKEVLE